MLAFLKILMMWPNASVIDGSVDADDGAFVVKDRAWKRCLTDAIVLRDYRD
jgi:hypothetical protein